MVVRAGRCRSGHRSCHHRFPITAFTAFTAFPLIPEALTAFPLFPGAEALSAFPPIPEALSQALLLQVLQEWAGWHGELGVFRGLGPGKRARVTKDLWQMPQLSQNMRCDLLLPSQFPNNSRQWQ